MKIVFFGTSEFAIPSLKALVESRHKVLALVTQPDSKKGRQLKVSPPATKVLASSKNIPVYQPINASSRESVEYLKNIDADLFVVVSFGQILSKDVITLPKIYSVNLHGSLLPKYRGAAPTNWVVINGDSFTGVTVMKMNEKLDEGDIILKKEVKIDEEDTNITISEEMSELGAAILLEAIDSIENGRAKLIQQDSSQASYAPKLKKEDGLINWNEPASKIHNKVRGLIPWPGAYTHYDSKILKILQTAVCDLDLKEAGAGEVIDIAKDKGIVVKAGQGSIAIKYVQLEGKKAMDAASFLRGHKMAIGDRLHSDIP